MATRALAFLDTPKLIGLLKQADPRGEMSVTVMTHDSLALGLNPLKPAKIIDFSEEKVRSYSEENSMHPAPGGGGAASQPASETDLITLTQRAMRYTGQQWFELNGIRTECRSVRELLINGLRAIEAHRVGTLDKLSRVKKRTKRIVARDRNDLFEKPHLIERYAEQLLNGWWVGTNNSSDEVGAWLSQAVSLAGLQRGKDFRCSLF